MFINICSEKLMVWYLLHVNKRHFCPCLQGSIFFPLPDGTGLMFNLVGTADAPRPNGKVTRDIPCKTWYNEMLPVHNWLKKPQR